MEIYGSEGSSGIVQLNVDDPGVNDFLFTRGNTDVFVLKVPMKRIFFWQKNRHLGTENQKIQEKFARKVLKGNLRVSNIPNWY